MAGGCKKGDMAVVLRDPHAPLGLSSVGEFVDVLDLVPGLDGTPACQCTKRDRGRFAVWFGGWLPGFSKSAIIPDDWLQPIRGLPRPDTAGTHRPAALGAPREEAVCAVPNERSDS